MEETKQNETPVSSETKSKSIEFSSVFTITMYVYFSLIILGGVSYLLFEAGKSFFK